MNAHLHSICTYSHDNCFLHKEISVRILAMHDDQNRPSTPLIPTSAHQAKAVDFWIFFTTFYLMCKG